jgi:RecA-family ATPase
MTDWPNDPRQYAAADGQGQPGLPPLLANIRNGAWLDAQEFPPLQYAVPGIIPEGLVFNVGPPKIGKSWLVLSIALARATGGRALGLQLPKGPVLYLALEDGDRRMQDRCRRLLHGAPIPAGFEYQTVVEHGRVLDTLQAWLEIQRDPGLAILDTLGKVMPPALQGESAYQRDYRVGSNLKELTDQSRGSTILVNHHDRKADSADFVDSVSGTNGLAGAADTIVVVTRPRLEEDGLIQVTGRDVPEGEYAVSFQDGHYWNLNGNDLTTAARVAQSARAAAGLGDRSAAVIALVAKLGQATADDVAAKLGMDPHNARTYLARLAGSNRLTRLDRGLYGPVASVASVASEGESTANATDATHATPLPGGHLFDHDPDDPRRCTH